MNIARLSAENLDRFGEYPQFTFVGKGGEVILTNVEIERRSRALATGLGKLGVNKGDIVAVILTNVAEIPQTINAILRRGAVFLPVIFALTATEVRYILDHSGARFIITEKLLLPKVREAMQGTDLERKLIVLRAEKADDIIPYAGLLNESGVRGDVVDTADSDLAVLMYTSGTTGFPKGVMLSHGNLENNLRQGAEVWPPAPENTSVVTLPMNHLYGLSSYFQGCAYGDRMVLLPRFDPEQVFEVIGKYGITVAPLVPTMITMLMQAYDPARHDIKSLRVIISSGAPLAEATLLQAMELFQVPIIHAYGLTEASPTVARQRLDRYKVGSVGPALPGLELKIIDDSGKELPVGLEGEIICKGPGIMQGYWKMPRETAAAVRDGWLYTGDVGRLDEDGDLYITGRKKDLIIKGGENIDPGVSEKWLYSHPAVSEAAVIGIADGKYGEEVAAAVTLKPGMQASEAELIAWVREHVHHFSAPSRIFFLEDLPKNNMGKILKKELRASLKK